MPRCAIEVSGGATARSIVWIAVSLGAIALALPACGASGMSPGSGAGGDNAQTGGAGGHGGGATISSAGGNSGSLCTFTMTGAQTSSGPCIIDVATGILAKSTDTSLSVFSDGVSPSFILSGILSHAIDFHVGRYDMTNIVSSGTYTLVPEQLVGWGELFNYQNMPDQGAFSLVVTDTGTPLMFPPGTPGLTGIAGWQGEHGTLDLTLAPLDNGTTGQVIIHATF